MKKIVLIFMSTVSVFAFAEAQETAHNFGNLKIHNDGQLGFFGDFINDGSTDDNEGLAGFYNQNTSQTVLGIRQPIFFDMEVDVPQDLNLEVSVGVSNYLEFTKGRVLTPREDIDIHLDFTNNGIYNGDNDDRHVDGYINNDGELDFKFPIGDDFRLRSLTVFPEDPTFTSYTAAYFFEDPNAPSTLSGPFTTSDFQNTLSIISTYEYWDLDGLLPTEVELTWDEQSNIDILTDELSSLRVVGFSKVLNQWVDLGNTSTTGNMDTGSIRSDILEPNEFSALTFGSVLKGGGSITVFTAMSPNGDGVNDVFIVEGLETSPDNELILFNRWGVQVYSKKNYDNTFDGTSDGRVTIDGDARLPAGTYYYVLKLKDQKDLAGAFYINR